MASSSNSGIEKRSIEMVPDNERHGTARSQFTLWFGANTQITAIVDGALAVVFGADALWAIIGLLIGNIIGGIVMALHSAQGPQLGLPQMISSRAQFGIIGAIIPLVLVVLMYIGFASTGAVLSGQAVNLIIGVDTPAVGIVIFGALTAAVALLGYKYIHVLGRISSVTGLLGFLFITYCVFTKVDVPGLISNSSFAFPAFLSAIALSVGWQLTYGPYVADYSRYLPRSTPASKTFWFTFGGSVIGSQWSMTLGALIGAAAMTETGNSFVENQVSFVGDIVGGGVYALLIFIVILLGKLTVNTLNAYGAFMCTLTILTSFGEKTNIRRWTRAVFVIGIVTLTVLVALLASADFLANFKNFVLALLMVFTPWSIINLTDYYLISKDRFDIPAFYDLKGRYGKWNWRALVAYGVGVVVQIPFLAQSFYTGPMVEKLGGADISWIVGIVVTFLLYFFMLRNRSVAPSETIYPDVEALDAQRSRG
ncbi:MAG: cytosine permease [Brevibacterium aurantiacum]|nr:cytosine permease [Brevibacterium aurantiacum]